MNTNKFITIILGILVLGSLLYLSSCVDDTDSEFANCDGTTCDSQNPYSNQYTNSCYSSKSDCESATGHTCVVCD